MVRVGCLLGNSYNYTIEYNYVHEICHYYTIVSVSFGISLLVRGIWGEACSICGILVPIIYSSFAFS